MAQFVRFENGWAFVLSCGDTVTPPPCNIRFLQLINAVYPNEWCQYYIKFFRWEYIETVNTSSKVIHRYYPYVDEEELEREIVNTFDN